MAETEPLECTMDETDAAVIDYGSAYLKVGFSGEDAPREIVSSARRSEPFKPQTDGEPSRVMERSGRTPLDEADLEQTVLKCLRTHLKAEPSELPILFTTSPSITTKEREKIAEVMFEKVRCKALCMFNSAALSLFASGRTRGLVVEVGDENAHSVPVYEGYAIPHAVYSLNRAGREVTNTMTQLLANLPRSIERGQEVGLIPEHYLNDPSVMQALKESVAAIAPRNSLGSIVSGSDPDPKDASAFQLPDGKVVYVPHSVRYSAPEILFSPQENEQATLQSVVRDSMETIDPTLAAELGRSIVGAGGGSLVPGFMSRLQDEVTRAVDPSLRLEFIGDPQRQQAAWVGGSMFASLSTFEKVSITAAEYEEAGAGQLRALVAKKSF